MEKINLTYLTNLTVKTDSISWEITASGILSLGKYRVKLEVTGGNSAAFTFTSKENQIESISIDNAGSFRFYGELETLEFLELMYVIFTLKMTPTINHEEK